MIRNQSLPLALFALLLASPALAQPIIIDDFSTDSATVIRVSAGTSTAFDDGSGILQTERNLRVSGGGFAGGSSIEMAVSSGSMSFTRSAGVTGGTLEMWWDGNNNTATFMPTGLGGINLTAGGQNRFVITVDSSTDTSSLMALDVWTDGGNRSTHTFTLPGGGGTVTLLYSGFSITAGTGANFTNVGAIFLRTADDGTGLWVASINDIRTQPVELMSFSAE